MTSASRKHANPDFSLPDLITVKRDKGELSLDQIKSFIDRVSSREADRSQIGAMLMAMYLNGMNRGETVAMTRAMMQSGEILSWPTEWKVVDKHSTGGVGDKVSLPLAPALAACGLKVPMISGRGLGHTGGTLDKLESIPGYKVECSSKKMLDQVTQVGCCIVGQSENLVPADKTLYSIRDVTATVECDPLIVGSIISKKAAEGLHSLVLDVKCGRAGWKNTKTQEGAHCLARYLVDTAEGLGIETTAVITEMSNPIGFNVGNALEVEEAIHCLQGKGPADLQELVCVLGAQLLVSSKQAETTKQGADMIKAVLNNGKALEKFQQMLVWQGVEKDDAEKLCTPGIDVYTILPRAENKTTLKATTSGRVKSIDALEVARVMYEIGVGRTSPEQSIDYGVGVTMHVHVGQYLTEGSPWCTVFHNGTLNEGQKQKLINSLEIEDGVVEETQISSRILEIITKSSKPHEVMVCQ